MLAERAQLGAARRRRRPEARARNGADDAGGRELGLGRAGRVPRVRERQGFRARCARRLGGLHQGAVRGALRPGRGLREDDRQLSHGRDTGVPAVVQEGAAHSRPWVDARRGSDLGGLRRAARHPQRHVAPDDVREVARCHGRQHRVLLRPAARQRQHDSERGRARGRGLRTCAREAPGAVLPERLRRRRLRLRRAHSARRAGGERRLPQQYWRANSVGSERYVQTPFGSVEHRLEPHQSGYSNLFLAGDWTRTGIDGGCVEAAVLSGRAAAKAIAGLPVPSISRHGPVPARPPP